MLVKQKLKKPVAKKIAVNHLTKKIAVKKVIYQVKTMMVVEENVKIYPAIARVLVSVLYFLQFKG